MHKISIIIPTYNQGRFIEDTFKSIINQDYENYEIIVLDACSTDNTLDVINKYETHIAYWHSKKDKGQSDAINQGFKLATGDIVTWLNSDDVLLPGTLRYVDEISTKHPDINWFLGNCFWMDKVGNIIKTGKFEKESMFWNKHFLYSNGGPSAFMRREKLLEIGMLGENFHYMMDTELWSRYLSLGEYFVRLNKYCWCLRIHEDAKMSGHNFANSELSKKNHPSWKKKMYEQKYLDTHYPVAGYLRFLWRISKIFDYSILTRLVDRKYLGKNYMEFYSNKNLTV